VNRPFSLIFLTAAILAGEAGAAAAQRAGEARGWSVVPQIAIGRHGVRWGGTVFVPRDTLAPFSEQRSIRPGASPMFALALHHRGADRLSFEFLGGITATDYTMEVGGDNSLRGVGSLHLYRFVGGASYRLRPNVPGYFAAGAGATYHNPREPMPTFRDDAQWMPTGYVGVGIDMPAERPGIRVDMRLYGARPAQREAPFGSASMIPAKSIAIDGLFSLGAHIRF
jgi:hypothetical protein